MLRDTAIAVSLANLCFLPVWYRGLPIATQHDPRFVSYSETACWGALIGFAALALIFRLLIAVVRRSGNPLIRAAASWGFIALLILAVHAVFQGEFPDRARAFAATLSAGAGRVAAIVAVAVIGLLLVRFRPVIVRAGLAIVLLLSPFVFVTLGQTIVLATSFGARTTAPPLPVVLPAPRVVWMVFDELDQRLAFAERPPSLELPELDRLRSQSIFATDAHAPADYTLLSMPSLISGRVVIESQAAGPSSQRLRFAGDDRDVSWSETASVFSRARALGVNAGLTGWYYQYDRLIGSNLVICSYRDNKNLSVVGSAIGHLATIGFAAPVTLINMVYPTTLLVTVDGPWNKKRTSAGRYRAILADAMAMAVDRRLGLVFIHWPIPHTPLIYDRRARDFSTAAHATYLDNLALVDRAVGEVRAAMDERGLWDDAIVIVTSDHPVKVEGWEKKFRHLDPRDAEVVARGYDPRVPFIVKLAGQRDGVVLEGPFNTVATHDLVLDLLAGKLSTTDGVMSWLKNRQADQAAQQ